MRRSLDSSPPHGGSPLHDVFKRREMPSQSKYMTMDVARLFYFLLSFLCKSYPSFQQFSQIECASQELELDRARKHDADTIEFQFTSFLYQLGLGEVRYSVKCELYFMKLSQQSYFVKIIKEVSTTKKLAASPYHFMV